MGVEELVGLTINEIDRSSDELVFKTSGGDFKMYHSQDCCESVYLEDVAGELDWLIGSPILHAVESSNSDPPECGDSWTWTFYRISTIQGTVVLRWLGTSNGYYSESVDFEKM